MNYIYIIQFIMKNNSNNDYDSLTNTNYLNIKRILKDVETNAQVQPIQWVNPHWNGHSCAGNQSKLTKLLVNCFESF